MMAMSGGGSVRLIFFPVFHDQTPLADHFFRLQWYLSPFRGQIEAITIPRASNSLVPGTPPSYLDPSLPNLDGGLPYSFVTASDEADLADEISKADVILLWDADALRSLEKIAPAVKARTVQIDHDKVKHAGSHYLRISERFPDFGIDSVQTPEEIFNRIARRCTSDIGYIFGTGPSLALALERGDDFSDGVCIACNSMVRNHDLLERLNPPLFVIADPVFHAGPSSYAAAFRAELVRALDRFDADLLVPMRDYHIYAEHLPDRFRSRIVPVRFENNSAPNLDLGNSLQVATTSNVLTLFLVPLATTLFDTIRTYGFDGRPLERNGYFWNHDRASQFNDQMREIQQAHPAFFTIDYDEYYRTHCDTLERWLAAADKIGKKIENYTPTFIPALLKRSVSGVGQPAMPVDASTRHAPLVSIVMPAFNAEAYIESAIRSVQKQSYENWELLVIDDGSTDATARIVEPIAAQEERISLLKSGTKGVSGARNTGVRAAKGQLVGFLDADDLMHPMSIEARVRALLSSPDAELVHSHVVFIDEQGRNLEFETGIKRPITFMDMFENAAHINTWMARAELFRRFGFPEERSHGEDWIVLARILRSGVTSLYVPAGFSAYRVHASSAVLRDIQKHERELEDVVDWIYSGVSEDGVAPRYAAGLVAPTRTEVRLGRQGRVLMWHLWRAEQDKLKALVADAKIVSAIERQSLSSLRWQLRGIGVRCLGIATRNLGLLKETRRENYLKIARAAEMPRRTPRLYRAFEDVLSATALEEGVTSDKRPLYADFGDWLRQRSPRIFLMLRSVRRTLFRT